MRQQLNFFESQRTTFNEQLELTIQSLKAYGEKYDHWVIAWSGGKDSTALVTLVVYLIESGQIPAPKKLTVLFADTRMEIPPLFFSAQGIMKQLRERGIRVETVMAPMDDRFFVYMMGRGVPPPSNTFRWCTPKIKVEPMMARLREMHQQTGKKFLLLTGVRQGESAKRDGRIAMSCGKDGAECGQGWYQVSASDDICDKLAPLLHWRVCSVWDWLSLFAPMERHGSWKTALLADVYGGEEAEEINARTGCIGCPLASKDKGLMVVIKIAEYNYLAPLMELKKLYRELKKPRWRKRKTEWQYKSDGSLSKNQNRMGPLTMEARKMALYTILKIQQRVNLQAKAENKPRIDIINIHEVIRINELIAKNTWPRGWTGKEEKGDFPFIQRFNDGNVQSDLFIKPSEISI
ncbi:phosphoadenosine phosphosulfate reductase family protein [Cyclobacterium jeungdonense]|uniref:Phosphoadenosine phosphosulfate reductase family protein n=1 Tax=Cyclobacterium jeungdonense TaxID=708087 RepID=A0ABT8C9C2_9BACT|nr:phosphoadenosine phosphosulfate reductase family protein [Cyclobacterium jeungdonense]MDN3689081.1 phosphoadenosine phosphosulfate reductase family protein [Cyclobacterium jeungdonense]